MAAAIVSPTGHQVQLGSKELTKMMLRGQKVEVLKYLRSLPPEESSAMRRKLLEKIENMKNKRYSRTSSESESSGSEKLASNSPSSSLRSQPHSANPNHLGAPQDTPEDSSRNPSPFGKRPGTTDVPIFLQSSVERANLELAGKFKVGEVIGKGGFGTVLKGISMDTGDFVAIKQIDKDMIDSSQLPGVMKEAEILKRLNHPNIVKIFSFLETPNTLYFVLEYVESGSLAGLLKKFGVFPEQLIASYTEQMLRGLKYLHEEGIIHRDIKGDNILITKEGKVKLADFGTAKLEDAEKKTQTVVGTPYWMAPEVIEMSACGPTSDIWSLSCTVIELLTGSPPYFELGPMSALFNIVEDRHPPLPEGLSEDLRAFLKACFKKDPSKRPTAAELLEHRWIKKYAKESSGDIEAVTGTLRQHNNQVKKKSVLNVFEPPASVGSERKKKPSSTKKPKPNIITSSSLGAPRTSDKKLSSKLEKVKLENQEQSASISELQVQYENEKKQKEKLEKDKARLEKELALKLKEKNDINAQLKGLELMLKNIGLESKDAKQALQIVRAIQSTVGKDTYMKLAYGHMSRQTKSIRPGASIGPTKERRHSI